MIKKLLPFLLLVLVGVIFFWQFLFKGLLPIPADTIVGLYHPYRDLYVRDYPNGAPFKNFLITDSVRQQYPWRKLSIDSLKNLKYPNWNPYSFAGTPLAANIQSAPFYPLNILFFFLSFELSWSILIFLEPLLAGIFMFAYLRNLKLDSYSSFFGAIIFSFSGFFTTWLEWGTILHVALWLPLILLSVDKISKSVNSKKVWIWSLILIFSSISSFFAGHLQTFFYLSLVSAIYVFVRIWQKRSMKLGILFLLSWLIVASVISVQLIPALKFIMLSARDFDQMFWQKDGWFIPWQNLAQLIAPDFFGNPTTLNFWGTWNYGELTGYIGILPLIIALYGLVFRRDKKVIFFGSILFASLIFSFPNPLARLPFILKIPFISTAQPTRLLFLVDFSLAILAALGLNHLMKKKQWKEIILPIGIVGICLVILFVFTAIGEQFDINTKYLLVAKRNLILPSVFFIISSLLIFIFIRFEKYRKYLVILLILITILDLFRFSWKFNTFSKKEYLYPWTKSISYIKNNIGDFRIATADPRILTPNFSVSYKIQSAEGYDPLYLDRYGEFISAINRNKPDIHPPYGFNRIVRIDNFSDNLVDLIGIKYVLALDDLKIPKFEKVYEEGQTKVYENKQVIPRTFFVEHLLLTSSKQEAINLMFDSGFDPNKTAVVENSSKNSIVGAGDAKIVNSSDNKIVIETENLKEGFLVLTDSYYPSWHAKIDGGREAKIFVTDFAFRGIFIPAGKHTVVFQNSIL